VSKLSRTLLVFVLLVLLASCFPQASTAPMLKIGLVAPFEGLYRALGYEVLPAVKLAVRERNRTGGVGGYVVEVVALNDDREPQAAPQRARELALDPDVMGVIGHFGEQTTLAALSTYHEAGLALVVPATTAPAVTEQGYGQTFRLVADDRELGAAAARYAVLDHGARRVAVVGAPSELVDAFVSTGQQAGAVVSECSGDHLQSLLASVSTGDHDLIFFGGEAQQAAELLTELRKSGLEMPFMGANGLDSPHLVEVAGHAADGTTYVSVTPPVENREFIEGYTALSGGPPGPYAALAYDAAVLLLDAMERSIAQQGKPTRAGVASALSGVEAYDGLTGRISFDEEGQAMGRRVYVYEIVDAQYPGQLQECPRCALQ
jgi:branched-chain amino acid transport system substrate-binding protein